MGPAGQQPPSRHLVVLVFLVAGLVAGCESSLVAGPVAAGSTQRVGETTYPAQDRRPAPDLSGTAL